MRYGPGSRSAWWRVGSHPPIPEDLGILLPTQTGLQHATHLPMARVAAAVLIDAVRCLHTPRHLKLYQEALRYLMGPDHHEAIPCEQACQLAGIDREHLRRRLRAAGFSWDAKAPSVTLRIGKRYRARHSVAAE